MKISVRYNSYSGPVYVDMKRIVRVADPEDPKNQGNSFADMNWRDEAEDPITKVFIGQIPIMLKSKYCQLSGLSDQDLHEIGECPYDQVSYFFFIFTIYLLLLLFIY